VEHSRPDSGTFRDTYDRLLLWAERPIGCLLKVEFVSNLVRRRLVADLEMTLADRGIPFYEFSLPSQAEPLVVVEAILAQIERQPTGVLSIVGFGNAFKNEIDLLEAMSVVNYNRERLAANNLRQIWWMTTSFGQLALQGMPDLQSWFATRLQLTDRSVPGEILDLPEMLPLFQNETGIYSNFDDAQRRSQRLLQQFEVAKEQGVADDELLDNFLLPGLEALAEVGAYQQIRDLSLQFEGILGQLNLPDSPQLAVAIGRIARMYQDQGRYEEANRLYHRSLEIDEKSQGK
jgi:tetratricopeptide (TPR) repeat protein